MTGPRIRATFAGNSVNRSQFIFLELRCGPISNSNPPSKTVGMTRTLDGVSLYGNVLPGPGPDNGDSPVGNSKPGSTLIRIEWSALLIVKSKLYDGGITFLASGVFRGMVTLSSASPYFEYQTSRFKSIPRC